MAVVENGTSTVYSLYRLAFMSCTPLMYNSIRNLDIPNLDLRRCCIRVIKIIQSNSADGVFDEFGDWHGMYEKCINKGYVEPHYFKLLLNSAVKHGHIDCLKIVVEMGYPLGLHNYYHLSSTPNMPNYVYDIPHDSIGVCTLAAYFGQLECLEYAHQKGGLWDGLTCVLAVLGDKFDCLRFAVENGCLLDSPNPMEAAASTGNLPMLKYLHLKQCPWSINTCTSAAINGQLECLKYARDNQCPWDVSTALAALLIDSFEILRYAVDNGCPLNSEILEMVALTGPLTMFQYLHEHGAPWSVKTCSNAAQEGNLDCLMYARDHGCPWDITTCTAAVRSSDMECLRYVVENGCPMITSDPINEAVKLGNLRYLKYLHEHGCPWSEGMCMSLANQMLLYLEIKSDSIFFDKSFFIQQRNCLVYAWKHGSPWLGGTCLESSGNGRMDCLVSKPDHRCMWDSEQFCGYAAVIRQRELITFRNGRIRRLKGPITPVLLEPLLLKCVTDSDISTG